MSTFDQERLLVCVAEALETLAFVSIEPCDESTVVADPRQVELDFEGPITGQLSLSTSHALGRMIAETLLADAIDPASLASQADDALGELANVISGLLFREMSADQVPMLTVPKVTQTRMNRDDDSGMLVSVMAQGYPLTVCLRAS